MNKIIKSNNIYLFYINNRTLFDIIKEQDARYIFASRIVTGKVLDISYGKFMAYHGGKILLDGEASEVWNYDFSDEKHVDVRKYHNGSIQFQNFDTDIFNEKFDSIILFDSSYAIHNLSSSVSKFSKLLNDDGVFIISIFNGELNPRYFSNIKNIERLTKNQSDRILTKVFPCITFYSQLLSKKNILIPYLNYYSFMKKLIRSRLGNILLKFDKKSTFYKLYLRKITSRVDKSSKIFNDKIYKNKYEPIIFEEGHKPIYFIAICKK